MAVNPRWLIRGYYHAWEADTLQIVIITDTPCHMWLRWSNKPLRMHKVSTDFRGSDYMWDPYYCFVEWKEIEQLDPGDTIKHHFIFPGWFECLRRWFMFRATVGDIQSPSISPVFTLHAFDKEETVSFQHTELIDKQVAGVIDHANLSITEAKLSPNINAFDKRFNAFKCDGIRFNLDITLRRPKINAGAVWLAMMLGYIHPLSRFHTLRYYEPDYVPTNHRLEIYTTAQGSYGTGVWVANHGPETAYGIELCIFDFCLWPP